MSRFTHIPLVDSPNIWQAGFSLSSSVPPGECWKRTLIRQWPLNSKPSPVQHSSVVLSSHATESSYWQDNKITKDTWRELNSNYKAIFSIILNGHMPFQRKCKQVKIQLTRMLKSRVIRMEWRQSFTFSLLSEFRYSGVKCNAPHFRTQWFKICYIFFPRLLILWHVDPLLGNDSEISGYTTAAL
jgi:hypothetical protein